MTDDAKHHTQHSASSYTLVAIFNDAQCSFLLKFLRRSISVGRPFTRCDAIERAGGALFVDDVPQPGTSNVKWGLTVLNV